MIPGKVTISFLLDPSKVTLKDNPQLVRAQLLVDVNFQGLSSKKGAVLMKLDQAPPQQEDIVIQTTPSSSDSLQLTITTEFNVSYVILPTPPIDPNFPQAPTSASTQVSSTFPLTAIVVIVAVGAVALIIIGTIMCICITKRKAQYYQVRVRLSSISLTSTSVGLPPAPKENKSVQPLGTDDQELSETNNSDPASVTLGHSVIE